MSANQLSRTSPYYFVAFDREGRERGDDPGGLDGCMSARIARDLAGGDVTDVFLFAHGWKADVPAALELYDRWIGSMASLECGRAGVVAERPGFSPMWVGVHWPSQPWGDEDLGPRADAIVADYLARLGDGPGVAEALAVIAGTAAETPVVQTLSPEVRRAYHALDRALGLEASGVGAPPGDDREPFDPDHALVATRDLRTGSGLGVGDVLDPLRQLSFWTMKKRARVVGEGGMHAFLTQLRAARPNRPPRVHLVGHSFGCIVVSGMVAGPAGRGTPQRADSMVLMQGATSLWSFARRIPVAPELSGYFHRLVDDGLVRGPIVTTWSTHDTALGRFYPVAAGLAGDMTVAVTEYPRYGALGRFGARGLEVGVADQTMLDADRRYAFLPQTIHNLDASEFIRDGGGLSGAHNDIEGPEVAHAIWEAVRL